jgi:hypothetical protein
MMNFIYCFESEWLKKKRSLASWLVISGAFFTPVFIIIARIIHSNPLYAASLKTDYWQLLWKSATESLAIFLLPIGAIMAVTLIVQLEYKNNTWKQLHAVPQRLTTIFFAKLVVILLMMVQFFLLFDIGVYLCGTIPYVIKGISLPKAPLPLQFLLKEDLNYFITCLPIVALQYLLALHFKNFLVSIGAGFLLWVAALAMLSWPYWYINPYTYCPGYFTAVSGKHNPGVSIQAMSMAYFLAFITAGYVLYLTKKEKG